MVAKILRLPRFKGDKVEKIDPERVFTFDEALDTIGSNAEKWRDWIALEMRDGENLYTRDAGEMGCLIDADQLMNLCGVLDSMASRLHSMAELQRTSDSAAAFKPATDKGQG